MTLNENLIINADKQRNKVVISFDRAKLLDRTDKMPSTEKKIKGNHQEQIIISQEIPAARRKIFYVLHINKVKDERRSMSAILWNKMGKIIGIVIVINSMVIVPYPITAGSKVQIEYL